MLHNGCVVDPDLSFVNLIQQHVFSINIRRFMVTLEDVSQILMMPLMGYDEELQSSYEREEKAFINKIYDEFRSRTLVGNRTAKMPMWVVTFARIGMQLCAELPFMVYWLSKWVFNELPSNSCSTKCFSMSCECKAPNYLISKWLKVLLLS